MGVLQLRLTGCGGALKAALIVLWLVTAAAPFCHAGAAEDTALNKYYMLRLKHDPGALKAIEAAARQYPNNLTIQLEYGYAVLKQKDYTAGRTAFRRAVRIAPRRVDLWKQLGYIDINLGDTDAAIDAFQHASALEPDNQDLLLQLAYLQDRKGRHRDAAALFRQVMHGSDPKKAKTGCRAYSNLRGLPNKVLPKPWFGEVYTAPEYFGHYNVAVFPADVRVGVHYGESTFIDAYGLSRVNTDTRSGQTNFGTQLYSDNYAEIGGGIRVKPLADLPVVLYAETGAAYDLINENRNRWRPDFRAYAVYYDEWNLGLGCDDTKRVFGFKPVADVYADAAYYTRYNNLITTAKARPGLRLLETETTAVDLYGVTTLSWDVDGVPSNRFAEVGIGLALRLFDPIPLVMRVEAVHRFLTDQNNYSEMRALLEYSVSF